MYSGSYHFLLKILTTVVTMCAFCCPSLLLEYRHWTSGYHFFTVCIVKQWNGLVREVVWSPSLELFKIQLSKVLSSLFLSPSWAYFVRHPEVLSSLYYPTILFHLDFRDNCMDIFLILNSFLHFELLHLKESTEFSLPMFLIKDWPCSHLMKRRCKMTRFRSGCPGHNPRVTERPLPSLRKVSEESQDFKNTLFLCIFLLGKTTCLLTVVMLRQFLLSVLVFVDPFLKVNRNFFWSIIGTMFHLCRWAGCCSLSSQITVNRLFGCF